MSERAPEQAPEMLVRVWANGEWLLDRSLSVRQDPGLGVELALDHPIGLDDAPIVLDLVNRSDRFLLLTGAKLTRLSPTLASQYLPGRPGDHGVRGGGVHSNRGEQREPSARHSPRRARGVGRQVPCARRGWTVELRPDTVFESELRYSPTTALSSVTQVVDLLKPLLPDRAARSHPRARCRHRDPPR